ncbi:MAG: 4-alpha-glucanotransferase [Bacteroidaceae bacterium]|nr:4-alpha-glucanotransferase [Bacteroidaceae bacterium]
MQIHFQIEYRTVWGENLFLCLDFENGRRQCLDMQNDGCGNWFTDREFDDSLICGHRVQYRYMVRCQGRQDRIEEGGFHTVPDICAASLVLADRWLESNGNRIEQRSIAIPNVRLNGRPQWRGAGTAVPVFALRSNDDFGIGELRDLELLADWAAESGQSIIQTLPVNDTILTHTWRDSYPYSANSSFALNPIYIRLQDIGTPRDSKFAEEMERLRLELNALPQIDFERVMQAKLRYIDVLFAEQAGKCFNTEEYRRFFEANREWLEPYAIYCCLRDRYGTPDFERWKEKRFGRDLIDSFCKPDTKRHRDMMKQYFIQYHLHRQFSRVREYLHGKGILLKGDIPIGVNRHSCDAWMFPELFNMDCQAGAPPDDFAVDGQKWGMPTYNWERMKKERYRWFTMRFRKMADYFDAYRIDHLLGFFRIWEVPLKYGSGLMGRFNPALTLTAKDIRLMGFKGSPRAFASAPEGTPETNVLFLEDTYRPGTWHPRINAFDTDMFKSLDTKQQEAFRRIHDSFYYERNDTFWEKCAMEKLPALISATDMIVCGEDLGMIPQCVPGVMDRLRILSLEVQRMPKAYGVSVADPRSYPYLSVCTTSTHDMSVLRSWIENEMPVNPVIPHLKADANLCASILQDHLTSSSMFAIFPLQDWLSTDEDLRSPDPDSERINVPADPDNYWRYRMHLTLEELVASDRFTHTVRDMIRSSGR